MIWGKLASNLEHLTQKPANQECDITTSRELTKRRTWKLAILRERRGSLKTMEADAEPPETLYEMMEPDADKN